MVKKNGKNWKKSINQSVYHAIQKDGNIYGRAGAAICFF
jgi:hypothetical protein